MINKVNREKRLRIRVLHQKGLTVSEIAKEVRLKQDEVIITLKDIGLNPIYIKVKPEPHAFASSCGKRIKI